jgi:hypothetical protein
MARLVDLGIGHACASFVVRTDQRELLATLGSAGGAPVADVLEDARHALLEASPDRVVRSPVGRCEVSGPIPLPGATSPDGPHTHLLPGPLALGHELPVGLALPTGLMPAATFYGPPGWEAAART